MVFRDLPRRFAVSFVIAIDFSDGSRCLFHGADAKKTVTRRDDFAEPGILGHHRLAACEVADIPLAKPPAAKADVLVLSYSELRPRLAEILRVRAEGVEGHLQRRHHPPAMRLEHILVLRLIHL